MSAMEWRIDQQILEFYFRFQLFSPNEPDGYPSILKNPLRKKQFAAVTSDKVK